MLAKVFAAVVVVQAQTFQHATDGFGSAVMAPLRSWNCKANWVGHTRVPSMVLSETLCL